MDKKPAHLFKEELKNNLNNMFDIKKTTLRERREARHQLQNEIEQELINANVSLLKKIIVLIKAHNFQIEKHKKYY